MTTLLIHDTLTLEQDLIKDSTLTLESSANEVLLKALNDEEEACAGWSLHSSVTHGFSRTFIFTTRVYSESQLIVTLIM